MNGVQSIAKMVPRGGAEISTRWSGFSYISRSMDTMQPLTGTGDLEIRFVVPHPPFLKHVCTLSWVNLFICSLFSLLFNCKFLAVMSISLSHTCGPAAVLQGLDNFTEMSFQSILTGLLNNHPFMWHLVPGMVWAFSYFIITEIPHSKYSKYLPFFFSFLSSSSCFMGEIRRSKRSNRSQSECSKQLPWGGDTMPHSALPIHAASLSMSSLSWLPPPAPDPRRPGSQWRQERGTSFLAGALAFATAPGGVSGPLPDIPRREHLGQFGYCDFLVGIIRNLLAQK